MFLHVSDPRERPPALGTNVRLIANMTERLPGKIGVRVPVYETVFLQVAIASELPIALQTAVEFLHGTHVRFNREIIQSLLAPSPVHLYMLFHVLHPRELPAAVRTHVPPLRFRLRIRRSVLMRPKVFAEAGRARRREIAHGAAETVLAGMADEMGPHRRRCRVPFPTMHARIRPFPGVRTAVLHQMAGTTESLLAVRTRVVLLRRVRENVILQRADTRKPSLALRTGIRPFARVNPHVRLQVVRFRELPRTDGTRRHLLSGVRTEMLFH